MTDILEIDNFLKPKILEKNLINFVTGRSIPWTFFNSINYGDDFDASTFLTHDNKIIETQGFSHSFYSLVNKNEVIQSDGFQYVSHIIPFIKKFSDENFKLLSLRAVCTGPRPDLKGFYNLPHVDLVMPHKTLIYYCNDNDGDTIIFEEKFNKDFDFSKKTVCKKIIPKAGKAVLFDGLRYHTGSFSTKNMRILLNCNFI